MKSNLKLNLNFFLGLLLSIPAAYFVFVEVLKYEFGYPYLVDSIEPFLLHWGHKESFGLNINLLLLFGPVLGLLLNMSKVLQIQFEIRDDKIDFRISVLKGWSNLSLISADILLIISAYLFVESCSCAK